MSLSKSEEELMNHLWAKKKAYMKDLIAAYDDPKPATTTIATLLKRMTLKGVIAFSMEGKAREYYPLIEKKSYFGRQLKDLIKNYFNDSSTQFASFFTEEIDMSEEELSELQVIIDQQIKSKK